MSKTLPKWDDERTNILKTIVDGEEVVSVDTVIDAAEQLETTPKSVAAKLRKLGYEVASMAKEHSKAYTEAEEQELQDFLESNPNKYTYTEIASMVLNGSRSAKQIQGKILSMELTRLVKPTPKVERTKTYTEEEEVKLMGLLKKGNMFIEDIAAEMNREVNSIRGKILSITRTEEGKGIEIPKQRVYRTKDVKDPIEALGDISEMTVEEISETVGKSTRGVKTMLTRRGLDCKNYKGSKRAEKIAASA